MRRVSSAVKSISMSSYSSPPPPLPFSVDRGEVRLDSKSDSEGLQDCSDEISCWWLWLGKGKGGGESNNCSWWRSAAIINVCLQLQ